MEGGINAFEKDRLDYLFEICSGITGSHIAFWLTQEDFRSEIIRLMDCHTPITKELILHVMEEIYDENIKDVTAGIRIDFNFQRARRAIRQIKSSLSYNRHTPEGVDGLEESLNTDISRFGFLYRRITMPKCCLIDWFHVPEFVHEINYMIDTGATIDNQVFLNTASPILYEKARNRKANKELHIQNLRRGLNHLKRALEPRSE